MFDNPFQGIIDRGANAALCRFLDIAGTAAQWISPFPSIAGPKGKAISVALGMAGLAARQACTWDPDKPSEIGGGPGGLIAEGQCLESTGCNLLVSGSEGSIYLGRVRKLISAVPSGTYPNGTPKMTVTYVDCDGNVKSDDESQTRSPLTTSLLDGASCAGSPSPKPEPTPPTIPDYTYNDAESGCTLIVETLGFAIGAGGNIDPVYRISPGDDPGRSNRASGGVISQCNFEPVIYYQPGGNGGGCGGCPPYPPIPDPGPGDDGPDYWQDLLNDFIGGLVANIVADQFRAFFELPFTGTTYRVVSVCEQNSNGDPISKDVAVTIPTTDYQSAVLKRLDGVAELLQPLKDFKQPTCSAPKLQGDFRTISFISDERTTAGDRYLSKRFRYRSQSGTDLNGLVDHWKDFTWDAGPVCVQHSGHSWGTPQVWAATVDEGKRVILHAGGEAGVDPNQVGKWTVSGSDNPRFGLSGRMRVNTKGGYYWITERLGSNGRPLVATKG